MPNIDPNLRRNNIMIKAGIVALLVLLLMIPTFMITNVVSERQTRQAEAVNEVSGTWGGVQTITGPVVSIPYIEYYHDSAKNTVARRNYMHILPDQLVINGKLFPEKRHRSIYEIVVYNSSLAVSGSFSDLNLNDEKIPRENILYNEAFVSVGISDLRGIKEQVSLQWNGEAHAFNSGVETHDVVDKGISTRVTLDPQNNGVYNFSFNLSLKGSQMLDFAPVGKETRVTMSSNWASPKFDGAFLPDPTPKVTDRGFDASWKVLHLNRGYPQRWANANFSNVNESVFGINLLIPVNGYQKTDRSIKYAILFIGLTFLMFYFLELLNNKLIHPLQYLLVGFALCLFYLLLLSISEHVDYNLAYLISSVLTIGLIGWYTNSILKERKLALLITGTLIILYGFIFTIIQLEDYALLMGSFGLFVTLAVVMHYSRKIDWYNVGKTVESEK